MPGELPTVVYPLVQSDLSWYYNRDHRLVVPGSLRSPSGAQIIELRGWLRHIDDTPNRSDDPSDFHYDIELDPAWCDHLEVNLHQLMRIGSVLLHNQSGDWYAAASLAKLHIEAMSWRPGAIWEDGPIPNPYWHLPDKWPQTLPPQQQGLVWYWYPDYASDGRTRLIARSIEEDALGEEAHYISVIGALITDDPHWKPDVPWYGASRAWGERISEYGVQPKEHPANRSRWTAGSRRSLDSS